MLKILYFNQFIRLFSYFIVNQYGIFESVTGILKFSNLVCVLNVFCLGLSDKGICPKSYAK